MVTVLHELASLRGTVSSGSIKILPDEGEKKRQLKQNMGFPMQWKYDGTLNKTVDKD